MSGARTSLDADLHRIDEILLRLCRLAQQSMHRATGALIKVDVAAAESVIDGDRESTALHAELETRLVSVIARRSPVATDLRRLIAALRVGADLERMSALARHIAKLARRRYPSPAAPGRSCDAVRAMGEVAARGGRLTQVLLATRDVRLVDQIVAVDDEMDELHRTLLTSLGAPGWPHGVEPAVDLTLLARFYERYGDHTVTIANRVHFIVTGDLPRPSPRSRQRPPQPSRTGPRDRPVAGRSGRANIDRVPVRPIV